jgi:hypothetical protein
MLNRVWEHKSIKNIDKLEEIKDNRNLWFQEDNSADLSLYEFFNHLNEGFSKIQNYEQLNSFLSESETYFNKIRKKMVPYGEKREKLDKFIKESLKKKTN